MTSTNSAKHALSYSFSYGFLGGALHARKFKRQMQSAGYNYVLEPQNADIIIAHSAGCWLIPKNSRPKLIVYVGMPLNQSEPRKTILAANAARVKELRDRRYILPLQLKSMYHGLRQPVRNIRIVKSAKQLKPVIIKSAGVVFIANRHDPWTQDKKLETYLIKQPWAFINLPGAHDHIWEQPKFYIDIINHYATILA
jgi:hypothetical protein